MKRFLAIVLCLLLCLSGLAEGSCIVTAVTRCRMGPGTEYDILGSLPAGCAVTLVSAMGDWYYVETADGDNYWIHSKYARILEPATTPVEAFSFALPTASITLSETALTLSEGGYRQLTAVSPLEAGIPAWTSSNPAVAIVSSGMVMALSPGETVITAALPDGTEASCLLTVITAEAAAAANAAAPDAESYYLAYGSYIVDYSSAYVNRESSVSVEAHCAVDGDENTAWNTDGDGTGQWISLTVQNGAACTVSSLRLINGYAKSEDVWRKNARIRNLSVYCDGQYVVTLMLQDMMAQQSFTLPAPMTGRTFQFTIDSVYPGEAYADCALTELSLH